MWIDSNNRIYFEKDDPPFIPRDNSGDIHYCYPLEHQEFVHFICKKYNILPGRAWRCTDILTQLGVDWRSDFDDIWEGAKNPNLIKNASEKGLTLSQYLEILALRATAEECEEIRKNKEFEERIRKHIEETSSKNSLTQTLDQKEKTNSPKPTPEPVIIKKKETSAQIKRARPSTDIFVASIFICLFLIAAIISIKNNNNNDQSSTPKEPQILDAVETTTPVETTLCTLPEEAPTQTEYSKERAEYEKYKRQFLAGLRQEPRPSNGEVLHNLVDGECLAPLEIIAPDSNDYVIKLKKAKYSYIEIYVRGGEPVTVDVPLGTYNLYYACGSTWYGEDDLFGEDTDYYKMDSTFSFYEDDGYYMGYTLELYLQPNGNLSKERVDPEDF